MTAEQKKMLGIARMFITSNPITAAQHGLNTLLSIIDAQEKALEVAKAALGSRWRRQSALAEIEAIEKGGQP